MHTHWGGKASNSGVKLELRDVTCLLSLLESFHSNSYRADKGSGRNKFACPAYLQLQKQLSLFHNRQTQRALGMPPSEEKGSHIPRTAKARQAHLVHKRAHMHVDTCCRQRHQYAQRYRNKITTNMNPARFQREVQGSNKHSRERASGRGEETSRRGEAGVQTVHRAS